MHCTPVPAFPTDRAHFDTGVSDHVAEALHGAQVVVDVSPLMVCARRHGDGPGTMLLLHAANFTGDDVKRLVPADSLIA